MIFNFSNKCVWTFPITFLSDEFSIINVINQPIQYIFIKCDQIGQRLSFSKQNKN